MKRRRSREYTLQILFQIELTGCKLNTELLEEFWEGNNEESDVKNYTHELVGDTLANLSSIDETISKAAQHWTVNRMAAIDRNILRSAVAELMFRSDIPSSVVINEAIEIARKYSTEGSAPFINGILDKVAYEVSSSGSKVKGSSKAD